MLLDLLLNFVLIILFLVKWRILIRPNLITLTGFFLNVVILMIYATINYCFKFEYDYPNWFYFYMATTLLVYSILDNADGK